MDKTAGCIINPGSFIMYVYGGYKSGVKRDGADNIYSDWYETKGTKSNETGTLLTRGISPTAPTDDR